MIPNWFTFAVVWLVAGLVGFAATKGSPLEASWFLVATLYGGGVGLISYLFTCMRFRNEINAEKTKWLSIVTELRLSESRLKALRADYAAVDRQRTDAQAAVKEMDLLLAKALGGNYNREQFSEAAQNALATVAPIRHGSVRLQGDKERGSHFVERRRQSRDDTPNTDHSLHTLAAVSSSPSSSPSCSTSSDSPSSCD